METAFTDGTIGVLNETTKMIHKHETGASEFSTECGATNHVASENLRNVPLEEATKSEHVSKCGRCFAGAGGY